jgi:hypothetical protein
MLNANEPNSNGPKSNEPSPNERGMNEPATHASEEVTEDVSAKLRVIFRKKRRMALARQRQRNRCSLSVLVRVMFHVYRRMHRRAVYMFVRAFVGVNFVRVLHRGSDVVKPLD